VLKYTSRIHSIVSTRTLHAIIIIIHTSLSIADSYSPKWVQSKARSDYGEWKITAGEWFGDAKEDKGLQTSQDARHYSLSAKFDKLFDNKDKTTVIQFSVKFAQGIDCGGAYIKVIPDGLNQEQFKDDSPYYIMFGPDVCGSSTRRVHFIFSYKGKNLLWKKTLNCLTDKLTHVYTAIIKPDNTYEVHIDGEKKESGSLYEDWDFLPPKTIPDPSAKKPADWVDEREIPDPSDNKPEDWDKEPKFINDPEAKKPEDWEDEEDGAWEAPKIPNPEYKGEWSQKTIPNPAYKGEWKANEIDNPEYVHDEELAVYRDINYAGFEIWQVKAGTIFDDILVTDDVEEAKRVAEKTLTNAKKEKEMFDQIEADKRAKEEEQRKKDDEERKKREEEDKAKADADEKQKADQKEDDELLKAAEEKAASEPKSDHDEL
jgi:calreticulin